MKHLILTLVLCGLDVGLSAQRTFDVTIADSTYHMKKYWFVLYTKGDAAPLDSATSATTLQAHLNHQSEQSDRGLIVMAGPFGDKGDWRGLLLYDCDTKEEVEGYLMADPFVRAGQLKYEIHPWYGSVGTRLP
ncbi:MAG: hypothetical protein IPN85_04575 [Flavobacteriales bacterium]|jgi:uncharacterized protein YciI|nr:hypothetical protein [Flavobacteriales bacterium]MBK9287569.1 hypothetical protein [Flavobacteriales bacterium]MBL0037269.1 hypothetical protein [Flavobacteriales bacterium]